MVPAFPLAFIPPILRARHALLSTQAILSPLNARRRPHFPTFSHRRPNLPSPSSCLPPPPTTPLPAVVGRVLKKVPLLLPTFTRNQAVLTGYIAPSVLALIAGAPAIFAFTISFLFLGATLDVPPFVTAFAGLGVGVLFDLSVSHFGETTGAILYTVTVLLMTFLDDDVCGDGGLRGAVHDAVINEDLVRGAEERRLENIERATVRKELAIFDDEPIDRDEEFANWDSMFREKNE